MESLENSNRDLLLTWDNLTVVAPDKKVFDKCQVTKVISDRPILDSISGEAKSGRLLALMGPSGSGKTTLLNFLSNRIGSIFDKTGRVLVNNERTKMKKISAYLKQDDIFYKLVTVREHLNFHAHLRMGRKYTQKQINERIDDLLDKFDMISKQNIRIQDNDSHVKSLSGGERRRISIMTEMLTFPKILFADEPTTGLDFVLADSIVRILKNLAQENLTVICTIHQPASSTFLLFDDLYLITAGRVAYNGSIDAASKYFSKIGYNCFDNYNPADFYIKLVSIDLLHEDESFDRINHIVDQCRKETVRIQPINFNRAVIQPTHTKKTNLKTIILGKYQATTLTQFSLLMKRQVLSFARQPGLLFFRFLQDAIVGFLMGIIYYKTPYDSIGSTAYAGLLFFEMAAISINALLNATISIPNEFHLFAKEHKSNIYQSGLYFVAKTLGELPLQFFQSLLVVLFIYFMTNLRPVAWAFFLHFFIVFLAYQCSVSFGYFISSIAGDPISAVALSTPMALPLLLFGGFLFPESFVPPYFIWIRWISWFQYTYESLMTINFYGGVFPCVGNLCNNPNIESEPGEQYLAIWVSHPEYFSYNILALILLIFAYRILGVIILVLKINFEQKKNPH